jgi:hypothetical protein
MHSLNVRYNLLEENSDVKLYKNDTLLGENTLQPGNDEWLETWIWVGEDIYWIQYNTEEKGFHNFIIKNNGVKDKEEEYLYCRFIKI